MVRSLGVKVPKQEAEATRRALQQAKVLRDDLKVHHEGDSVVFPVTAAPGKMEWARFDFEEREQRPRAYQDLLPPVLAAVAPRAFETIGDIAIVKIPADLAEHRYEIGEALLQFNDCRAVFHDDGVVGDFRVRELSLIAGEGGSETSINENGVTLHVDPTRAYFSPRLADERARLCKLMLPGQRVIDLFGGVAPFAVQAARAACEVVCVDLNPDAVELAKRNAETNNVDIEIHCADAMTFKSEPADHVVMNLPHDAKRFFASALPLVKPGGTLHHHEIMPKADLPKRQVEIVEELATLGRSATVTTVRRVRDYSTMDAHFALDLEVK